MRTLLASLTLCSTPLLLSAQPTKPPTPATPARDSDKSVPKVQPKATDPSILPVFDTTKPSTYMFHGTFTEQQSHGTKTFDPSKEQLVWQVRMTPLAIDAEKHEVDVEVEFLSLQAAWTKMGTVTEYDSAIPFTEKPGRSRKHGGDPDGPTFNDVPMDKVIHEHFAPYEHAKVHCRVSEKGALVKINDEPVLSPAPVAGLWPCRYLYLLFGVAATNSDSDFNGKVRTDQK
jgi:hypothetical protein